MKVQVIFGEACDVLYVKGYEDRAERWVSIHAIPAGWPLDRVQASVFADKIRMWVCPNERLRPDPEMPEEEEADAWLGEMTDLIAHDGVTCKTLAAYVRRRRGEYAKNVAQELAITMLKLQNAEQQIANLREALALLGKGKDALPKAGAPEGPCRGWMSSLNVACELPRGHEGPHRFTHPMKEPRPAKVGDRIVYRGTFGDGFVPAKREATEADLHDPDFAQWWEHEDGARILHMCWVRDGNGHLCTLPFHKDGEHVFPQVLASTATKPEMLPGPLCWVGGCNRAQWHEGLHSWEQCCELAPFQQRPARCELERGHRGKHSFEVVTDRICRFRSADGLEKPCTFFQGHTGRHSFEANRGR